MERTRKYTYGDYVTWPEGERVELIDGQVFAMSPAPSRIHQKVLGAFHSRFEAQLRGKTCEVYIAPFDVRLPKGDEADEEIDTVVQPDMTVVCDPNKLDDRGVRGAPDLVVEVVSPSTMKMDLVRKKSLYERHGVRQYWIVYPEEKAVMVYRLGEGGVYGEFEACQQGDLLPVGIDGDFTLDLAEIFE